LPKGFRNALAEILQSRLPGALASNWALRPAYIGRAVKVAREETREHTVKRNIDQARSRGLTLSAAIEDCEVRAGIKQRTAWRVWKRLECKRQQQEKFWGGVDKIRKAVQPEQLATTMRKMQEVVKAVWKPRD
jgi:hypothetical protein